MSALIDKVDEILAVENIKFPAELARRSHKALAIISRGPPGLDQGYYYYGLLDCVSQLAAVSDPGMLGEALLNQIKDLIFDSVVPEFRWKAVSVPSLKRRCISIFADTTRRSKSSCPVIAPAGNSIKCW